MDISDYLGKVRDGFDAATSLADEQTQNMASRVASTVEPSVRLALIEAISDATNEINDELATADVSMTLVEGNPEFIVDEHGISVAQLASYDATDGDPSSAPEQEVDAEDEDGDESLVRFSLRLPKWAKDKVDRRAEKEGMSTNAYLTELIVSQVARRHGPRGGGGGFGPGPQGGGPGFGRGYGPRRDGPGFGPGRPGFGPRADFGPSMDPEMLMQLGRMFARGLGEHRGHDRHGDPRRGRDRRPRGRGEEGGERGSRRPAGPRDDD